MKVNKTPINERTFYLSVKNISNLCFNGTKLTTGDYYIKGKKLIIKKKKWNEISYKNCTLTYIKKRRWKNEKNNY